MAGGIRDSSTKRKRLLKRYPATDFITGQVTGASTILDSFDDGATQFLEFSTFGFGGMSIAAAGDSFTALLCDFLPLVDISEPIGVRVLFGADATPAAGDAVTWVVLYDQVDVGEALAAPATALDTAIAAHTPGHTTASRLERTARGIINANTFDESAVLGALAVNIEADGLTDYGADEVKFLALEFDYMPRFYQIAGQGVNVHTTQAAS
tara:strand:+ start:407 stop:1036 length:630 start_codon:yes stop_codon:yes gene_type:complete